MGIVLHSASQANLSELEKALGYTFRNKNLLLKALTHKSFHHENPESAPFHNERLEFLGDSVLGLVVTEYLFKKEQGYPESHMSKLKSQIVKGSVLSEVAADISLGTCLRIGKGEEETGGRHKKSIISDSLEAVFGAVYIDGGIENAKNTVLRLLKNRLDSLIKSGDFYDHKSALQEETQMTFGILPVYRLISAQGAEHKKIFTVDVFINGKFHGRGTGKTKKEAETLAAKEALKGLQSPAK